MEVVRALPTTKTGEEVGAVAIRAGRPNSSMAAEALKNAHIPPKVMVLATMSPGMCRGWKYVNSMMMMMVVGYGFADVRYG